MSQVVTLARMAERLGTTEEILRYLAERDGLPLIERTPSKKKAYWVIAVEHVSALEEALIASLQPPVEPVEPDGVPLPPLPEKKGKKAEKKAEQEVHAYWELWALFENQAGGLPDGMKSMLWSAMLKNFLNSGGNLPEDAPEYADVQAEQQEELQVGEPLTVHLGRRKLRRLYGHMQQTLKRFRPDLHHSDRTALALWTCASYTLTAYSAFPFLWYSGLSGSGKSKLFELVAKYAQLDVTGGITEAALLRSPSKRFAIDEFEKIKPKVLEYLNLAYEKSKTVARVVNKKEEGLVTERISVYGAYSFSGVNVQIPVTLESRSLPVMVPVLDFESMPELRNVDPVDYLERDYRDLAWFREHACELVAHVRECFMDRRSKRFEGRQRELWRPLLAMAIFMSRDSHGADVLNSKPVQDCLRFIERSRIGASAYTVEQITLVTYLATQLGAEDGWVSVRGCCTALGMDTKSGKAIRTKLRTLSFGPFLETDGTARHTSTGNELFIKRATLQVHLGRLTEEE